MYIRITSRCNMACDHCCYSCSPSRGKHMDMHIFEDAIRLAADYGEYVSLGGGEPTLHPRFFDILRRSMREVDYVWLATNGTRKKAMLRLADIMNEEDYKNDEPIVMDRDGHLSVDLSTDHWHDRRMVDDYIWDLWHRMAGQHRHTGFSLRNVSRYTGAIKVGRAERTGVWSTAEGCVCSDIIIEPDGVIRGCGCKDAPTFGTVACPEIPDDWKWDCHKQQEEYA